MHKRDDTVVVYLLRKKGTHLLYLLIRQIQVYLTIEVGQEVKFRITSINRTSILFVSVSFIILMIVSLAWLVFYYVQRFRYMNAKDKLAKHLNNAAKKALAKIPVRTIKSGDKTIADSESCAVCIEAFQSSDTLRSLPCKHEFHKNCVDTWLLAHRTCPMCKMDILKYYGYMPTEVEGHDPLTVLESGISVSLTNNANDDSVQQLNLTSDVSCSEAMSQRESRANTALNRISSTCNSSHGSERSRRSSTGTIQDHSRTSSTSIIRSIIVNNSQVSSCDSGNDPENDVQRSPFDSQEEQVKAGKKDQTKNAKTEKANKVKNKKSAESEDKKTIKKEEKTAKSENNRNDNTKKLIIVKASRIDELNTPVILREPNSLENLNDRTITTDSQQHVIEESQIIKEKKVPKKQSFVKSKSLNNEDKEVTGEISPTIDKQFGQNLNKSEGSLYSLLTLDSFDYDNQDLSEENKASHTVIEVELNPNKVPGEETKTSHDTELVISNSLSAENQEVIDNSHTISNHDCSSLNALSSEAAFESAAPEKPSNLPNERENLSDLELDIENLVNEINELELMTENEEQDVKILETNQEEKKVMENSRDSDLVVMENSLDSDLVIETRNSQVIATTRKDSQSLPSIHEGSSKPDVRRHRNSQCELPEVVCEPSNYFAKIHKPQKQDYVEDSLKVSGRKASLKIPSRPSSTSRSSSSILIDDGEQADTRPSSHIVTISHC